MRKKYYFKTKIGKSRKFVSLSELTPEENANLRRHAREMIRNAEVMASTFADAVGIFGYAFSTFTDGYKFSYQDIRNSALTDVSLNKISYTKTDTQAIFGFNMHHSLISLKIEGNAGKDNEKINNAQRNLKKVLKKFEIPGKWKRDEEGNAVPVFKKGIVAKERRTLEELREITFKYAEDSYGTPPTEKLVLPAKYRGVFGKMGRLIFEVIPHKFSADVGGNQGSILGAQGTLEFEVKIMAEIAIPFKLAYWMSSVEEEEDFIPYYFVNHMVSIWNFGARKSMKMRGVTSPKIRQLNPASLMTLIKKSDLKKQVERANSEGYTVLRNGDIFKVPQTLSSIQDVVNKYKNAFDVETGVFEKPDFRENADKGLVTDWEHEKLVYFTRSDSMETLNLNGAKALNNKTIYEYFRSAGLYNLIELMFDQLLKTLEDPEKEAAYKGALDWIRTNLESEIGTGMGVVGILGAQISGFIQSNHLSMAELLGLEDPDFDGEVREARLLPLYGEALRRICEVIKENFDDFNCSFYLKNSHIRFLVDLVVMYSKKYSEIKQEYRESTQRNHREPDDYPKKVSIPNVPYLTKNGLMPHQNKALSLIASGTEATILGVDPGGGKTITIIADILSLLSQKKIKRALVICPNAIVSSWVKEVIKVGEGKLNIFPLTSKIYNRLTKDAKLKDEEIVKKMQELPINSLVVTDYPFVRGRALDFDYLGEPASKFQNVDLLMQVGFDYVALDESHRIKKQTTKQTQAVYRLCGNAKYYRLVSGTIISNNPSDLVGQIGLIDPSILQNEERFKSLYGDKGGNWLPHAATSIKSKIVPFARQITIKNRDWAFLLPNMSETFKTVGLTPKQQKFYSNLLQKVLEEIRSDPKLMELMASGDEESAAEIERYLKRYFIQLERFINAPDSNKAFTALSGLDKEDLISPKVGLVDGIIGEHLEKLELEDSLEKDKEKVIIFGYHKVVSEHFFKHSRYRNLMVHYAAGDEDSLEKFLKDPRIQILVGDEASLKEGLNLQLASLMVRLQTLWSPGDQEQALARIFRPSPGRESYQREKIFFYWISFDNTIEIAKTARLISKIITKSKFDEVNNPDFMSFTEGFEELPLLRMNLDTIENYTSSRSLNRFFDRYSEVKDWEQEAANSTMAELKSSLEEKHGRKLKREEIRGLAMVPVDGDAELPNSKTAFTPWFRNVKPSDYPELKLVPIVSLDEDELENESLDDEEDFEGIENVHVKPGDLVVTEYGPGFIIGITKVAVRVSIPGFSSSVRVDKTDAYVPKDQKAAKKLEKKLRAAGNKGMSKIIRKGVKVNIPGKMAEPAKKEKKEKYVKPEDQGETDTAKAIKLHAALINGVVVLLTKADDEDAVKVFPKLEYDYASSFYYHQFDNFRAYEKFIDLVSKMQARVDSDNKKMLLIPEVNWDNLTRIYELYKKNKSGKDLKKLKANEFRNIQKFFKVQPKKGRGSATELARTIKPYPVIWDGDLLVLYSEVSHKISNLNRLFKTKIPGMTRFDEKHYFAPTYVKPVKSKVAVKKEVKLVEKEGLKIENLEDLLEEVDEFIS